MSQVIFSGPAEWNQKSVVKGYMDVKLDGSEKKITGEFEQYPKTMKTKTQNKLASSLFFFF